VGLGLECAWAAGRCDHHEPRHAGAGTKSKRDHSRRRCESFSLALKSDGTIWAWGENAIGQLGDGTTTERHTPVQVGTPPLGEVTAVAAGQGHNLALRSDGTVWAWGLNARGELGDGTTTDRLTPVQVQNLSGIKAIGAGDNHSLAVRSDGTVWAWGFNIRGQLGDGTTTDRHTPVQVQNLSGITAVAGGQNFSLARKPNEACVRRMRQDDAGRDLRSSQHEREKRRRG
jgi:alpha-tubulin suppressor-like RCC1 family protein